ncbi:DUF4157 domain-containing protein [Streptomyces sp. NBC_01477]|nr:DUF4157 domain-containing protein [Streptomyces sp. NBC_01477]
MLRRSGRLPEGADVQRSTVHDVLRAPGRPLDVSTRTDMEGRLGADFTDVRLHTGPAAQASAAQIGARAYTSGSHIVIGAGGSDHHTLAHELFHVIQQRSGPVSGTDNGDGLRISDPSDRYERAAEDAALHAWGGRSVSNNGNAIESSTGKISLQSAYVQRTHYPHGETVDADPRYAVILRAHLNGSPIGTFTSETTPYSRGNHAEDQLIDEIEASIGQPWGHRSVREALLQRPDGNHALSISLTHSPCSSRYRTNTKPDRADGCTERLRGLAIGGIGGHRFIIAIRAERLYKPRIQGIDTTAASRAANDYMRSAGIDVRVDGE